MNRKLRVLMLSLFVVLFVAVSAFAAVPTASEFGSAVVTTDDELSNTNTEGFNYYKKVSIDLSASDNLPSAVSWEIRPSEDVSFSWLNYTIGSLDVVITGILPEFSSDRAVSDDDETEGSIVNAYHFHVIAWTSIDLSDGEQSEIVLCSTDVGASEVMTLAGLSIFVTQSKLTAASLDITNFSADLISVDVDANTSDNTLYVAKSSDYSVTITFPKTTVDESTYFNALLAADDYETLTSNINLPSWLSFDVVSHDTDADESDGVYQLRIFYLSDTAPESGTEGNVRIYPVVPSSSVPNSENPYSTIYESYLDSDGNLTMGWTVTYAPVKAIALDVADSYDITAMYGTSTVISKDFTYHYQTPKTITFSKDISADVTLAWTATTVSTDEDENAGYITLTVTPVTPLATTYSTDMIVTDSNDNTATVTLYITVSMDAMAITPVSNSITLEPGKSEDVVFTATNFNGKVVSWDLGTVASGITVTSSDSGDYGQTLTLTITGEAKGDYSFDVSAMDSFDRTASAVMYVKVLPAKSGDVPGLKIDPVSDSVTVTAGGDIVNVKFTALDASGDVSWSFGTLPRGVTMVEANKSGDVVTYGVRASADAPATTGTVTVTASDDMKTATATLYITVSRDAAPASLTVTPSAPSVTVAVGATANVTLTASNNSGLVTWTPGTPSGGFTIAPATDTSYATENMTTMIYTVTGVTAGSYSVKVTATDAGGNTAEATISVTVTGGGTTPKYVDPTPSVAITEALASAVKDALAALLGIDLSGYSVVALPASAFVNGSAVTFVGTNAVQLPAIKVSEDNIYMFGVPLDNLTAGATMIWEVVVSNAANDEILEASAAEDDAVFIDNNSNIVTTVPSDKYVNVAAYFEAGKTYSPTIRTTTTDTRDAGVGSASSGCSAGFGAMVSALAAAFFISRKRS